MHHTCTVCLSGIPPYTDICGRVCCLVLALTLLLMLELTLVIPWLLLLPLLLELDVMMGLLGTGALEPELTEACALSMAALQASGLDPRLLLLCPTPNTHTHRRYTGQA